MKTVQICLTIPLRDYAAFEDLAEELGCEIHLKSVEEAKPKAPNTRHKVTPEIVQEVLKASKATPTAGAKKLKRVLKLPHGVSTINKILGGYYESL